MFCSKCGTNNPDGAVFCECCGTKLEVPVQPVPAPAPAPVPAPAPAPASASFAMPQMPTTQAAAPVINAAPSVSKRLVSADENVLETLNGQNENHFMVTDQRVYYRTGSKSIVVGTDISEKIVDLDRVTASGFKHKQNGLIWLILGILFLLAGIAVRIPIVIVISVILFIIFLLIYLKRENFFYVEYDTGKIVIPVDKASLSQMEEINCILMQAKDAYKAKHNI